MKVANMTCVCPAEDNKQKEENISKKQSRFYLVIDKPLFWPQNMYLLTLVQIVS